MALVAGADTAERQRTYSALASIVHTTSRTPAAGAASSGSSGDDVLRAEMAACESMLSTLRQHAAVLSSALVGDVALSACPLMAAVRALNAEHLALARAAERVLHSWLRLHADGL